MITPVDFKARFPEFCAIADETIQIFIDDSVIMLNESYWGIKYNLGLNYLTAHYLAIGLSSEAGNVEGAGGPITARTVDGSSVSYAAPTMDNLADAYYEQTTYGKRYLAMRKTLGIPAYAI